MPTRLCMRSLSLAPGPSSDCVSFAGFPGPRCRRRDAVIRVINGAAPGRCAHHPGITPGGVICGDRDNSPMGRGVRVAVPRVPASKLISHRPRRRTGVILRGDVISPVRQAALPRQGLIGDGARVFSRRMVSQRPGNSGPSTPVSPAATRYDLQHPLKRTGLSLGEPTWCKGRGPRPHEGSSTQPGSGVPGATRRAGEYASRVRTAR
jgi:hypothetical protein